VAAIIKVYRIQRFTVVTIREALQTPAVHVARGPVEAASAHLALLLPRLRLLHEQRTKVAGRIEALLEKLGERTLTGRIGLSHEDHCGRRRIIRPREPRANHARDYSSGCVTSASVREPIQQLGMALGGTSVRAGRWR
jgi:hypothetical protein